MNRAFLALRVGDDDSPGDSEVQLRRRPRRNAETSLERARSRKRTSLGEALRVGRGSREKEGLKAMTAARSRGDRANVRFAVAARQ